jgi:hypothetical protein
MRVHGMSLDGLKGVLRLPASCRVGDFCFWESLKRSDLFPPIVFKFRPKPPPLNFEKLEAIIPCVVVTVWEFRRFDYIIDGSLYHYYLRSE